MKNVTDHAELARFVAIRFIDDLHGERKGGDA
jgi:hypothetical protein